jgi:ketosteroid isomerase-like protein
VTTDGFRELMERLARAWSTQDTELGLSCFTEDALYTEPPDIQLYVGHEQLRPYFAALTPGTFLRLNAVMFDEAAQVGAAEYAFGDEGSATADHGVAVVDVRDERIAFWREYQRKGPVAFADFFAVEGKTWQWHIGNYP